MIVIETVDVEELIDACDGEHEHAALNHATRLWSSVCPATIVTHALCVEPRSNTDTNSSSLFYDLYAKWR